MQTKEVIEKFYESLAQKNDAWQELWSDDASFTDASMTLNAQGKDAVIQSFMPFIKGVGGIRVKQMIAEENSACAIISYDYINSKGEKMKQDDAEVWEVKDGKLSKLTLYFDITAYRTFMRG